MRETREQLNQELLSLKRKFLEKVDLKNAVGCEVESYHCVKCEKFNDCISMSPPVNDSSEEITRTIEISLKKFGFLFYEIIPFQSNEVRDDNIATSKVYEKVTKKLDKLDKIEEREAKKACK